MNFSRTRKLIYETRPEIMLREEFEKRGLKKGIDFAIQYPIKNSFILDFAFTEPIKLAIEVDGLHWHSSPKARKKDGFKNMILKRLGWKVLRFWDYEIYDDVSGCADKIMDNLK